MEDEPKIDQNFFIFEMSETSDDENDEPVFHGKKRKDKGTVSAKDKNLEKIEDLANNITQKLRIEDYLSLYTDFENLTIEVDKIANSFEGGTYPKLFFKLVLMINDKINSLSSDAKKKLNKNNLKGYNKLKQSLKKIYSDQEQALKDYNRSPYASDAEDDESEDASISTEASSSEEEKLSKDSGSSDEDSDASDDDGDDSSEDKKLKLDKDDIRNLSFDQYINMIPNLTREQRREYWKLAVVLETKKPSKNKDEKSDDESKEEGQQQRPQKERVYVVEEVDKDYSKLNLEEDVVRAKIKKICGERNRYELSELKSNIDMLEYICNNVTGTLQLEVVLVFLNFWFEYVSQTVLFMPRERWVEILDKIQTYFQLMKSFSEDQIKSCHNFLKSDDSFYDSVSLQNILVLYIGNIERNLDYSIKYEDRKDAIYRKLLSDELSLIRFLQDVFAYLKTISAEVQTGIVAVHILTHVYHVSDKKLDILEEKGSNYPFTKETLSKFIDESQRIINPNKSLKQYHSLFNYYLAYNHAINDRFKEAKTLLLKYNRDEEGANFTNRRLAYNRALVQTGLCAFRFGKLEETRTILEEICLNGRINDSLYQESTNQIESKDDRRNIVPFHLTIDTHNIESAYLIAVVLLDVPYLISGIEESFQANKLFLKLWQKYDKNFMYGLPEDYRDLIYLALSELVQSNWKECFKYIKQLPLWKILPEKEEAQKKILLRIKEQSYKVFLFAMKQSCHVLMFQKLSELFELDASVLQRITCKTIHLGQIEGSLSPGSDCFSIGSQELPEIVTRAREIGSQLNYNILLNEKLFDANVRKQGYKELQPLSDHLGTSRKLTKEKIFDFCN